MASWLVRWSLDGAVWIVLFYWARQFTLTVPLSKQLFKWPKGTSEFKAGGNPVMD